MDEGHPFNPMVGHVLAQMDTVKELLNTDQLKPIPSQFALAAGDRTVVASSISSADEALTIAEILNAEEYEDRFPDWADRLTKSYVLVRYHESSHWADPEGYLGWFSRVKLIKVEDEQYNEILGYMKEDNFPDKPPEWLIKTYDVFQTELAATSPDQVPAPIKCGECGEMKVSLHIEHGVSVVSDVGTLTREGKTKAIPIGDHTHSCHTSAKLVCTNCAASVELTRKTLTAPPDSPLVAILNHWH